MRGSVWVLRLVHEKKAFTAEAHAAKLAERWSRQNGRARAVEVVAHLSGPEIKLRWRDVVKYNAVKRWVDPKLREAGYDPAACKVTAVVEELTGCSAPQAAQQGGGE